MGKRPVFLAIVTTVTVVVVSLTLLGFPPGRSDPEAFAHVTGMTHLHVDADPTNGTRPCDPIDSTRTVQVGQTYDVALCLEGYTPNALEAFLLRLYYGGADAINTSPTLEGPAPMLDLNPDANDGDSAAGLSLGSGWDCSGFGIFPPVGDDLGTPPPPGNAALCLDQYGQAVPLCRDAVISCNANLASEDLDLSANPGLLATVEFTATGEGTEQLTWGDDTQIGGPDLVQLGGGSLASEGFCGSDVPSEQIQCLGATIRKVTFECLFEDPTRGTSLGLFGDDWQFDFPGGSVAGTGRVRHIGNWTVVTGRQSGLLLIAFGSCPSGPARAFAINLSHFPPQILRLSDPGDLD
jgi:hypothetical protein